MNLLENLKPKRFSLSREILAISGRHLSLPNRSAPLCLIMLLCLGWTWIF